MIRVGFFTVFRKDPQHYALADILVRSVRAAMPGAEVVHLTDETSPPALGVDVVVRKPNGPILQRRMEHYADLLGDWLLLDTDVVVQRDVRDVFDRPFDVALADREWSRVKDHYKFSQTMPYNTGVVFQRHPRFYQQALRCWHAFAEERRKHWWSEQWAVADAAFTQRFAVRVLPGMTYNRPPADEREDVSDAAIVHYKGPDRKLWMTRLPRASAEVPECA